ncbi:MAG: hypothetical protein QM831_23775 [Kofleriaceae bacterium]
MIAVGCGNKAAPPAEKGSADKGSAVVAPVVVEKPAKDYKTRAEQYAARCKDGCGDADACHELLLLAVRERGIADGQVALSLASTTCAKGDKLGCMIEVLVGVETIGKLGDPAATRSACIDKADKHSCELALAFGAFATGNAQDTAVAQLEASACKAGVLDACDSQVKQLGSGAPKALVDQVTAACADGDADACAALGKPIADAELCSRHDFAACERSGDATAFNINASGSGGKVQRIKELAGVLPSIVKSCGNNEEAACKALARFATPNPCK